jgi:hypothetical protein
MHITNKLIVCGDSFSIGIGCPDLHTQPYGSILAKKLDLDLVNFAKGSSTNLSIYLQAKYVVEKIASKDDIVLVSNTSYDRVEWFPVDHEFPARNISNVDVNYHQYPPYGFNSYHAGDVVVQLPNPMADDPEYNGKMFTENLAGVVDYWETYRKNDLEGDYYARFKDEPKNRTKILYDYAASIHEPRINRIYSIAVLGMAHQLLKRAGIRHLMLTHEVEEYSNTMDRENLLHLSWGDLALKYPDKIKTWHTSPEGHVEAADIVFKKLKENGWTL